MTALRPPIQPARAEFSGVELEAYDAVVSRFSDSDESDDFDLGEYFGALVNSPVMCSIASAMGTFVRTAGDRQGTYSHVDREFADQVLSVDWKTNVVQRIHLPDALAVGVRLKAIEALRSGAEDKLTDDERLLASYIRGVVTGTLSDEVYEAMQRRLGARGLIEYTAFVLWLQWCIRMMQALGTEDPPDEEFDEMIAEYRAGIREHSDWRAMIR